jgi:hypothetical protein
MLLMTRGVRFQEFSKTVEDTSLCIRDPGRVEETL